MRPAEIRPTRPEDAPALQVAIALYERTGFVRDGQRPGAWRLGGVTRDMLVLGRRNPHLGEHDRTGGG